EQAAGSLEYEYDESSAGEEEQTKVYAPSGKLSARDPDKKYSGKTYNSVESIDEFFRKRTARMGASGGSRGSSPVVRGGAGSSAADKDVRAPAVTGVVPGSYVRHAKYGRGLVLRREGSGDQTKLTVSFPGYGPKKLVEK